MSCGGVPSCQVHTVGQRFLFPGSLRLVSKPQPLSGESRWSGSGVLACFWGISRDNLGGLGTTKQSLPVQPERVYAMASLRESAVWRVLLHQWVHSHQQVWLVSAAVVEVSPGEAFYWGQVCLGRAACLGQACARGG